VRLRLGKDFEDKKHNVIVSSGMRYRVDAPLGHPAVFYRTGSEVAAQLQAELDAVLDPPVTSACPPCELFAQPQDR
jgi:siroheme synthase